MDVFQLSDECGGRCVGSLSLVGLLMAIAVSADAQCRQETSIGGMALQGFFIKKFT